MAVLELKGRYLDQEPLYMEIDTEDIECIETFWKPDIFIRLKRHDFVYCNFIHVSNNAFSGIGLFVDDDTLKDIRKCIDNAVSHGLIKEEIFAVDKRTPRERGMG